MKRRPWWTMVALASHAPIDSAAIDRAAVDSAGNPAAAAAPEPTCTVRAGRDVAVVWPERVDSTGITWWFERRDRSGRAVGPRVELGWGYEGPEACAIGYDRGRYLATWTWWDPYGGQPELRTAVVERDRRIAQNGKYLGPYFDLEPIAVVPARYGWVIHYRYTHDDETVHHIRADRDGRLR